MKPIIESLLPRFSSYHSVPHCSSSLCRSVNLHRNITCQTLPSLPCLSRSHSITLCALGAMIAAQAPGQIPFLLVQGGHHSHWLQCSMPERGKGRQESGLWRCSTDHPGGPRIMRQDLWALQEHGQCDPPRTPPQVSIRNIVCDIVRYWRMLLSI
jgi:hypothetical protein